ncbi:hypothetical protein [Embleya sp. NPDC059237]|uniref:hypothetical protein n=1 Tax=Embleya sp. NPDC059237 TaxID=3346784 RepID=UPI0036B9C587
MIDFEAGGQIVFMPARTIHLNPTDHPRSWRLSIASSCFTAPDALQRVAFHLTDTDVAGFAETLLRPPRPQDRGSGRVVLIRDGIGLRLRVFVESVDGERPEPRAVVHLQEHHRQVLLDDIKRHRPDLIPTAGTPEPRLCLDPMPVTGLTIDQVADLHDRLDRWLSAEGIRAAIADRVVARHIHAPDRSR